MKIDVPRLPLTYPNFVGAPSSPAEAGEDGVEFTPSA